MWMLIDLSFLAHRALHSTGDLETDDIPTGVLFGFFEQLYSICSNLRFTSNKVCIFTDSRKSYRSRKFPAYKKKRREDRTEEEQERLNCMYDQIRVLKKHWLPDMGMPTYRQVGLESDDLLAYAAQKLTEDEERGVLVTSDGDLYQCITEYVTWYDPGRDLHHDQVSFQKKKGISCEQWGMVKAIGGCGTDCVPGIKGVSEKGAIDYLHDKIPHHYKKYEAIQNAMDSGDIDFWKELVVLPHKKTKPFELREPEYNAEAFFEYCAEYDIDSYLEGHGRRQWEAFFKGHFHGIPTRRRRSGSKQQRKLI